MYKNDRVRRVVIGSGGGGGGGGGGDYDRLVTVLTFEKKIYSMHNAQVMMMC